MAYKSDYPILESTADDEPVFALVGRDRFAAMVVRIWATIARSHGVSEEKCRDAESVADAMDCYGPKRLPD